MNQQNQQPDKPNERPLSGQEQYEMLKRCSDKEDMTEWNNWRMERPDIDINLQNRNFSGFWLEKVNFIGETVWEQSNGKKINFSSEVHLEGANFKWANLQQAIFTKAHLERSLFESANVKNGDFHFAHLENADLVVAHFENCDFTDAILENASLTPSELNGTKFTNTDLRGCSIRACVVNGSTRFWNCHINRYSKSKRFTDLTGTALNNVIITPGEKQLFEYNIRRQNWEEWYKDEDEPIRHGSFIFSNKKIRQTTNKLLTWLVRRFWWISDYGISTKRIIFTFLRLALVFSTIYYFCGLISPPGIIDYLFVDAKGVEVAWWLVPIRAIHFSIVIMTVGFTNMHANAHSFWAHVLVGLQMILGYVLLGALVTRFAVLFTAGGPAGKFSDEKR